MASALAQRLVITGLAVSATAFQSTVDADCDLTDQRSRRHP
jgi:hypothetical protein